MIDDVIPEPAEFEWDEGNIKKNVKKHGITNEEAEEVFANQPAVLLDDKGHSEVEKRYLILGKNDKDKKLSIIFTLRKRKIRIISARPMNRKEREQYEQK